MGAVPAGADDAGAGEAAGDAGTLAGAGSDDATGDDTGADADPVGVVGETDVGGPGLTR